MLFSAACETANSTGSAASVRHLAMAPAILTGTEVAALAFPVVVEP
jgi:hypothetical protein